jgi:hypothetical protein
LDQALARPSDGDPVSIGAELERQARGRTQH